MYSSYCAEACVTSGGVLLRRLAPGQHSSLEETTQRSRTVGDIYCRSEKVLMSKILGFVTKCIQLYETTVVRHGLMLVGPTCSGKTKCYNVLGKALTKLKGQDSISGGTYEAVHVSWFTCVMVTFKSSDISELYQIQSKKIRLCCSPVLIFCAFYHRVSYYLKFFFFSVFVIF